MVRIHVLSLCMAALTLRACVPRLRVGQASPCPLFVTRHVTLLAFWPWLRNVTCQSWTSWCAFVQSCEVISISEPSNWRRRTITPSVVRKAQIDLPMSSPTKKFVINHLSSRRSKSPAKLTFYMLLPKMTRHRPCIN